MALILPNPTEPISENTPLTRLTVPKKLLLPPPRLPASLLTPYKVMDVALATPPLRRTAARATTMAADVKDIGARFRICLFIIIGLAPSEAIQRLLVGITTSRINPTSSATWAADDYVVARPGMCQRKHQKVGLQRWTRGRGPGLNQRWGIAIKLRGGCIKRLLGTLRVGSRPREGRGPGKA